MNYLDRKGFLKRYPWSAAPIQVALCTSSKPSISNFLLTDFHLFARRHFLDFRNANVLCFVPPESIHLGLTVRARASGNKLNWNIAVMIIFHIAFPTG